MSKNTSAPQSLRSPLGRARGLGSSRSGVSHWWVQRLTAMGMLPLVLYCLISFILIADADLDTARAWIGQPFNSVAHDTFACCWLLSCQPWGCKL
jgi:succinate dehydrogenase / fumarate reductase membrane anchor subunit